MRRVSCVVMVCVVVVCAPCHHFPIKSIFNTAAPTTATTHAQFSALSAHHSMPSKSFHHLAPHPHTHMTLGEGGNRIVRVQACSIRERKITHLSGVDLLTAEGVFVGTHSGGVVLWLVVFLEATFAGYLGNSGVRCKRCQDVKNGRYAVCWKVRTRDSRNGRHVTTSHLARCDVFVL